MAKLTKKYRFVINAETGELTGNPFQTFENDTTFVGEGFIGLEFDTLENMQYSYSKSLIWTQEKPYRLVVSNTEAIKALFDGGEVAEMLKMLMPDFKEQYEANIVFTYIYLASIEPYNGIEINYLLETFPNLFLRLEENTNFINANIVE